MLQSKNITGTAQENVHYRYYIKNLLKQYSKATKKKKTGIKAIYIVNCYFSLYGYSPQIS